MQLELSEDFQVDRMKKRNPKHWKVDSQEPKFKFGENSKID